MNQSMCVTSVLLYIHKHSKNIMIQLCACLRHGVRLAGHHHVESVDQKRKEIEEVVVVTVASGGRERDRRSCGCDRRRKRRRQRAR